MASRSNKARFQAAAILAVAGMLWGCKEAPNPQASNTAVLGASGLPRASASLPAPPAPRTAHAQLARLGDDTALAVWEDHGNIMAARYLPVAGWQPAQALEDIGGQSSIPRIGSNANGVAMVIWQHTVGRIESLRYSRYEDGRGFSEPDVMPGALPRPRQPGKSVGAAVEDAAPKIEVDAAGHVRAQWRSGFNENEIQVSTFVAGEGWSRPVDVPYASAK